ncbi:hypothetical protein [Pseudobacteroides cellulosolvens]|uniref:Uncharacterized protein n=1 Tax=Pseudobacteroides cellulosolvens ATCC 35603 = DSM 2933 TaxID=398512 RepID=A0A0L6JXJ9_9FIRM|nr:hypothetical protein [Pseudobacteroides cellulosolvens]KNY30290.1 hypothetical protein Bccel_5570 [Pseudobacteroides cellulosolvens ATCC 35603 = DSM 2933]
MENMSYDQKIGMMSEMMDKCFANISWEQKERIKNYMMPKIAPYFMQAGAFNPNNPEEMVHRTFENVGNNAKLSIIHEMMPIVMRSMMDVMMANSPDHEKDRMMNEMSGKFFTNMSDDEKIGIMYHMMPKMIKYMMGGN